MTLSIVVAMDTNQLIGAANGLPWHLPADLKYFKQITLGKPVIMGRKTFESIGRILPGRHNIILSQNKTFKVEQDLPADSALSIVHSLTEAIEAANKTKELKPQNADKNSNEIMVIGGATLFEQALPMVTKLYLTKIKAEFVGDTYFPKLAMDEWQETWREEHLEEEGANCPYIFLQYERKKI